MEDYDNFEPAPFMWIEDGNGQASTPRTRKKTKRKIEYVGWGSRELIEFLQSIGKDTTNALTQYDVTNIINLYVNENKCLQPSNKRRVLSDDKLFSLFLKKSFFKNKIYELLEIHLAENHNESDDEQNGSSDENDGDASAVSKKQKTLRLDKKILPRIKVPEVPKSCLVAINSENIKLVYLRKSVVQEMLNNPETFENKVVGSYVRVKSDPHDIFQKNSHQLQLVTGVMEVADAGNTKLSKILQVSGMADDISISELSEDNFSEEEIEDLRKRVKDGLLKQPTIGELEQKVVVLHEDITKNWLARELKLLKSLIDRACEKGWRHKVAEHLDRRKLLESPAEQSRLLGEIPKVMPEEVKPDEVKAEEVKPEEVKAEETYFDDASDDSPKAADWDLPYFDSLTEVVMTKSEVLSKQDCQAAEISTRSNGEAHPFNPEERNQPGTDPSAAINNGHVQTVETEAPIAEATRVESNGNTETLNANHVVDIPSSEKSSERNGHLAHLQIPSSKESEKAQVVVILSDDDDDDEQETPGGGGGTQLPRLQSKPRGTLGGETQIHRSHPNMLGTPGSGGNQIPGLRPNFLGTPGVSETHYPGPRPKLFGTPGSGIQRLGNGVQTPGGGTLFPGSNPGHIVRGYLDPQNRGGNQIRGPHPELLVWHYYDPLGNVQGPFSLMSLKRWNELHYFPRDFKVWMSGQKPQQAVQLSLILQHLQPN